jgi:hypothetical protein
MPQLGLGVEGTGVEGSVKVGGGDDSLEIGCNGGGVDDDSTDNSVEVEKDVWDVKDDRWGVSGSGVGVVSKGKEQVASMQLKVWMLAAKVMASAASAGCWKC